MMPILNYFAINAKRKRDRSVSLIILIIISLACLLPFINKAFHIDDPLYIWAARQIQSDPINFYGFNVNWYKQSNPMFDVMKNPPLASYYIALVAGLFGWSELVLHLAFLIPALAAIIGTYYLASEFCQTPLVATLVGICTPVFLLSSTSVMCDIMMLSFWVWATVLWIRGMKSGSILHLTVAAVLIALSSLTKYFGMSLMPLLFVYSYFKKRTMGLWSVFLFIPVLFLALYQWLTLSLYGRGLLVDATSYALGRFEIGQLFVKSLTGLFFTGGCFISVLFFSFLLWRKRTLAIGALILLPFLVYYFYMLLPRGLQFTNDQNLNWLFIIQCILFSFAGLGILALAASDLWQHKDADALFLFLWISGTVIFSSLINWTVNGRSLLPMFPAIGILVLRRIEQRPAFSDVNTAKHVLLPIIATIVIALTITWADYKWASTSRQTAVTLSETYKNGTRTVWFEGHWGFQYYMEKYGGKALDRNGSLIKDGDAVIIPLNNSNIYSLPMDMFTGERLYKINSASWFSTMNVMTGAGFYSSEIGPLPFVLGPVPDEKYAIFLATIKK